MSTPISQFDENEFSIPLTSLAYALRRGQLVIIIGAGVSRNAGLPTWAQLLQPLRDELDLDTEDNRLQDPVVIASVYERRFGPQRLRDRVCQTILQAREPSAVHIALAQLPAEVYFTTNYDQLLELALERVEREFRVIATDADYGYLPGRDVVKVYKLHGDGMSPTSLVLTKKDYLNYSRDRTNLLQELKRSLKTHTALFIGVGWQDSNLERVYEDALKEMGEHGRRAYIVFDALDPDLVGYYDHELNLKPILLGSYTYLTTFLEALQRRALYDVDESSVLASAQFPARGALPSAYVRLIETVEHRFREAFEQARGAFDRGCYSAALQSAKDLLTELVDLSSPGLDELRTRCHLLAAQAELWVGPHPDFEKARHHLEQVDVEGNQALEAEREVVAAIITYRAQGPRPALARLETVDGLPAARVAFAISSVHGDLTACRRILTEAGIDIDQNAQDPKWGRHLAVFLTQSGNYQRGAQIIEDLLAQSPSGVLFETLGQIHTSQAFRQSDTFLEEHHVPHTFAGTIGLDLTELVDRTALEQAITCYKQAADFYQSHHEEFGELENLERTLRLLLAAGQGASPQANVVLARSRTLDPDHLLLQLASMEEIEEPPHGLDLPPTGESLRTRLERGDDPLLVCQWIDRWLHVPDLPFIELANTVQASQRHFNTINQLVAYTDTVSKLYRLAGDHDAAVAVIRDFVPPAEQAYLTPLMQAVFWREAMAFGQAEKCLDQARAVASDNPAVLAFGVQFYGERGDYAQAQKLAEELVNPLPTAQTYVWYLQSLLAQKQDVEFLEALDRAAEQGIAVPERFTVLFRARSLLTLGRSAEAIPLLERARELALTEPVDLCDLALVLYQAGQRDRALALAQEITGTYPDVSEGHLRQIELLRLEGRFEEAFGLAKTAAERFRGDERIQLQFALLGFEAGHAEEASIALQDYAARFPDSPYLRRGVGLEELKEVISSMHEARYQAELLYRAGALPTLYFAYSPGINMPYWKLWYLATRNRAGLYVAPGDQTEDVYKLAAALPCGMVIDYPALVTLVELLGARCLQILQQVFSKVYLPTSFREVLTLERAKLSWPGQPDLQVARKHLAYMIEDQPHRFTVIEPKGAEDDLLGDHTALAYAEEQDLLLLDEHPVEHDEVTAKVRRFGLTGVAELLFGAGHLDAAQRRQLLRVAKPQGEHEPDLGPLRSRREIVADLRTLETLAGLNLLRPFADFFERVYIARQDYERLRGEVRSYEKRESLWERFVAFSLMLEQAGDFVEWVSVEDPDRRAQIRSKLDADQQEELIILDTYYADLFALAEQHGCLFMTDDRVTKVLEIEADVPLRFGTDTLLRYLHQQDNLDRAEFVRLYQQLIDWNYRHLPPEPEYLIDVLPAEPQTSSPRFESAVEYYRDSFLDSLRTVREGHPFYREKLLAPTASKFTDGLWTALRLAHQARTEIEAAARLIESLAFPFFTDQFRDRQPEYLVMLLGGAIIPDARLLLEEPDNASAFLPWLDEVLRQTGFEIGDIDLAWRHLIEVYIETPVAQTDEGQQTVGVIVGRLLERLSERTRTSIFNSPVGDTLRDQFGLNVVQVHQFRAESTTGVIEYRITESQLRQALDYALVAALDRGVSEVEYHELQMRISQHDFFVRVEALPSHPAYEDRWDHGVRRIAVLLHHFLAPDPDLRRRAQEIGLQLLRRLNRDTARWNSLAADLQSPEEDVYSQAGQACLDILANDHEVFFTLLRNAASIQAVDPLIAVLSILKPAHVANWFGLRLNHLHSMDAFMNWARQRQGKVRKELVEQRQRSRLHDPQVQQRNLQRVLALVEPYLHSLFEDAELWRELLLSELTAWQQATELGIEQIAGEFLSLAERSPSYPLKANVLLTFIEWAADIPHNIWIARAPGTSLTFGERATRLLEDSLDQPMDLPRQDHPLQNLALIGNLCAVMLYGRWIRSEEDVAIERLRYLTAMASGLIAQALMRTEPSLAPNVQLALKEQLRKETQGLLARPIQQQRLDARGFYRPEWSEYLHYPVSFLMPGITPHLPTVVAYLISDDIRQRLLDIGYRHSLYRCFLADELQPTWLDGALDTRPASGIDEFLRRAAGDSLEFWPMQQRALLHSLEHFDAKATVDAIFQQVPSTTDDDQIIVYFYLFSLGAYQASDRWMAWTARWLEPPVKERLQDSARLYGELTGLARLVVLRVPGTETAARFADFLLSTADEGIPAPLLHHHAEALAGLGTWNVKSDQIAAWLRRVAGDSNVDVTVRRTCVRTFIELWPHIPLEAQGHIGPVLTELAHMQPFEGFIELSPFQRSGSARSYEHPERA